MRSRHLRASHSPAIHLTMRILAAEDQTREYHPEGMCRLFALHADQPVTADLWLLEAPYSLREQSRFNADGTGLGWIDDDGRPQVLRKPVAAYSSPSFSRLAATLRSRVMIAHVRLSSGSGHTVENTHPFLQDGIITAHNGVLDVTQKMRDRVRRMGAGGMVHGTTDSEWMSALVTAEVRRHDGDLRAGVQAALGWIARNVPVYSVNLLAAKDGELVAVRLPAKNELWVLDRRVGAGTEREALDQTSSSLHAHSEDLADTGSVVIASEPMDDDPAWRLMDSGELLHVTADGHAERSFPFPELAHSLDIEDLGLSAAASQAHAAQARAHEARRLAAQSLAARR